MVILMNNNSLFWKLFAKRTVLCFTLVLILFFTCVLRVAVCATTDYTKVSNLNQRLKLTVNKPRGTIYDCNMVPLTNNKSKIIGAISPTPRAVTALSSALSGNALKDALERLKNGKPILCELPYEIECDGIECFTVYDSDYLGAAHILGYTNSDGVGVSGIEKAYNNLLYSKNENSISYTCDAKGGILGGIEPDKNIDDSAKSKGVITTLDINIQAIAEEASEYLTKGAIIVSDCQTGEIKSMVSKPYFDKTNVHDYLKSDDSPLLNRAISAYNVGSVFKPCVAAVGIEKGFKGFCYTCTGSCEIVDRFFNCHKSEGHSFLNLKGAIANSCNTFFYNFAFKIGGEDIYNLASTLRFDKSIKIGDNLSTANGNLPQKESLKNIAYLANLSIGQGELLLSPINMITLYNAIATNGSYYIPSIIKATIENGTVKPYNKGNPTKVFESETAAILRDYLAQVLIDGTGENAKPQTVSAAGKTATAQTGKYKNGVEICGGWFCGFFPLESPKYTVIVFSEDITTNTKSCNEIFAIIADKITALAN